MQPTTVLLLGVALAAGGCGEPFDVVAEDAASAQQTPDAGTSASESISTAGLITFPCTASSTDRNHMASRPPSGCPNLNVSDQNSLDGMEYFQRFRRHLGLACLEMRPYAQNAAAWHAVYMSRHAGLRGHTACFVDGHSEKPGCEFFSGVTPRDQLLTNGMDPNWDDITGQVTGEAIACKLGPSDFFSGMLGGPFHREALMNPRTDFGGFATFWQNHLGVETWANTITMTRSIVRSDDGDPEIVRYPRRDDVNVPLSFNGKETPQPPAPPGRFPSGYPLSIFAKPGYVWSAAQLCLSPSGSSCTTSIPFVGLFNSTLPRVRPNVAHIYATGPLLPGKRYRVRFIGTKDGSPVNTDWAFTTRN